MRLLREIILSPLVFLCLFALPALAGQFVGEELFTQEEITIQQTAGFDVANLPEGESLMIPGCPLLPVRLINVALPPGAVVHGVDLLEAPLKKLDGAYDVMPCARPRRISNPAQGNPFIKDMDVYDADTLFPGKIVEVVGCWDLAGQDFVTLRIAPLQYNPVTKKLYLARSVEYEVDYSIDPNHTQKTYNFSPRTRESNLKRLRALAVNPAAISIPLWSGQASRALAPGNWDYVIITTTSYQNEFDTLVDFHTKTGLKTTVVTTDYIYANYSGSDNPAKIRNFVIDAHTTWGAMYYMIGGDSSRVPYDTKYVGGDNIPTDTLYSDYDEDWKCEVYVGRAPIDSTTEIATFVSKTMAYMNNPPSDFGDEFLAMAFDLDSGTQSEPLMNWIIGHWLPTWVDLYKEYDSESGDHEADVKAYINAGKNLVDHSDHCNWSVVGVGSYRHGDHIYNSECQAFNNNGRWGLFDSTGCYPGAFDYSDCWGEEWIKNANGGGIAFVGNSRYGWYVPGMGGLSLSGLYNRKYFKMLWDPAYLYYRTGEAHGESKNDTFPDNGTEWYCFTELNVLGDPALTLLTDTSGTLTCTFNATLDPGLQCYAVDVESGGNPVEDALVCLWKGDQVYATALTGTSGSAGLIINPQDAGSMYVTVTAQNHKPHFGSAAVQSGTLPDLAVAIALDEDTYHTPQDMFYDVVVGNSTTSSKTTTMWTNVTLPNMKTYPLGGFLDGPTPMTLGAGAIETLSLTQRVPRNPPLGTYVFNVFIGPEPGVVDEDHWMFTVVD